MLSKEPRSEDALDKMRLILFGGSSKAEGAAMWFSVKSSLLTGGILVPSCPHLADADRQTPCLVSGPQRRWDEAGILSCFLAWLKGVFQKPGF